MADGLVTRFSQAGVPPPIVLYTDRECCSSGNTSSKYKALFPAWENVVVKLDIFHFMQRFAVGCSSEVHPLYAVFMGSLSRCIFEWDARDVDNLDDAKKKELVQSGVKAPSDETAKASVTKTELAKHCRRQTRGTDATTALLDNLFEAMKDATDVLGVPLFKDEMLDDIWPEQRKHVACIQDPPEVQLYTTIGSIKKGGVTLPVYRCARGTTSLENMARYNIKLSLVF